MKKKVALLLVLVMIVTSLPMIVFGNDPLQPNAPSRVEQLFPNAQEQYIAFDFPATLLNSATFDNNAVQFRFTLGGGNNDYRSFSPLDVDENTGLAIPRNVSVELLGTPTPNAALSEFVTSGSGLTAQIIARSTTEVIVVLQADGSAPAGLSGRIQLLIPAIVNHNDTTLAATLTRGGVTAASMPATRLVAAGIGRDITFGSVTAQNFTDLLRLPHIQINENAYGNFLSNTTIRVEAPFGYTWRTTPVGGTEGLRVEAYGLAWGQHSGTNLTAPATIIEERVQGSLVEVLYLNVTVPSGINAARNIRIHGLHLVPDLDRAPMGPVSIQVAVLNTPSGTGDRSNNVLVNGFLRRIQHANNAVTRPANDGNIQRVADLQVGTRTTDGITATVLGDNLPVVRTGYLNLEVSSPQTNLNIGWANGASVNTGVERGIQTARVQLRELTPGAWGTLLGDRLEFTFEQQGVEIVGAAARAGRGGTNLQNLFPLFDPANGNFGNNANRWYGGWLTPGNTASAQRLVNGNVTVLPNRVEVLMPQIEHQVNVANATAAANYRLTQIRTLEIIFWISVEAGFEARNPGEDIYVTIGGRGAAGITGATTLAVARPEDPISVVLTDGPIQLSTDLVGDTVANQFISDIEITIYEPHRIPVGSDLIIFVSGIEANRNLRLHMYADRVATVSGRGLQLAPGNFSVNNAGVLTGNQMSFRVERVPNVLENDGPITVTITGVRVTGTVVPNVEYFVVVAGDAVAENWDPSVAGTAEFTGHPYPVSAISNVRAPGGAITGPTPGPSNVRPSGTAVNLHSWDHFAGMSAGQPALRFEWVNEMLVGMVSVRAFANVVGYEEISSSTLAGMTTATIVGYNVAGELVEVTIAQNSPNAVITIDGVAVPLTDLATWAGAGTGLAAGELTPMLINGNFFLPARAMANIFGWDVAMINEHVLRFSVN